MAEAQFPFWKSLRFRLILMSALTIVVLGSGLGYYAIRQMRQTQHENLMNLGRTLAKTLSGNTEYSVWTNDIPGTEAPLASVMEEADVLYARISKMDGGLFAEKTREGWTGITADANEEYMTEDVSLLRDAAGKGFYTVTAHIIFERQAPAAEPAAGGEDLLFGGLEGDAPESAAPPKEEPAASPMLEVIRLGRVEVGVSLERTKARIAAAIRVTAIIASVGIFVVGMVSVVFANRITRPIHTMVEGAFRMGQGDFSTPVQVTTKNELSILAASFNKMQEQIREQLEKIETARKALWGEMQLAKKIQTVLLPERIKMPNYDVAVSMFTADEVGGDYYDFLRLPNGREWFAIGDVSGHGVTSGLIMMMAESALHTCLHQRPDLDPKTVMQIINHVIYDNTKRMGIDIFMTLIAMVHEGDGRFTYSGAHEEFLIYRAKDKTVESITLHGAWAGAFADIERAVDNYQLMLYPGDVLLLFSDGVVEAKSKENELYGSMRAKKILGQHAAGSAADVHNALISDVRKWMHVQDDDITILVIKREG